jgi:hypothetical protein
VDLGVDLGVDGGVVPLPERVIAIEYIYTCRHYLYISTSIFKEVDLHQLVLVGQVMLTAVLDKVRVVLTVVVAERSLRHPRVHLKKQHTYVRLTDKYIWKV